MKIKYFKSIVALSLLGLTLSLSGCKEEEKTTSFIEEITQPIDPAFLESEKEEVKEETEEVEETEETEEIEIVEIDTDSLEYNSREQDIIVALQKTDILDADGNRIGIFKPGTNFVYLGENDNQYLIDYYGEDGYVPKENMTKTTKRVIDQDMISKGYIKKDNYIYDSKDLSNPTTKIDNDVFIEIYKEFDKSYLVQTIDTIGFVEKDKVNILEGDIFVTDKSNQEGRFYKEDKLFISMPVVTGRTNTRWETPEGLFKVHTKAKGYFDIQPGYKVKCVMYYDSDRGLHTAEWRKVFGGDENDVNGSHGCTNCPEEKILEVYEYLDKGEHVFVQH